MLQIIWVQCNWNIKCPKNIFLPPFGTPALDPPCQAPELSLGHETLEVFEGREDPFLEMNHEDDYCCYLLLLLLSSSSSSSSLSLLHIYTMIVLIAMFLVMMMTIILSLYIVMMWMWMCRSKRLIGCLAAWLKSYTNVKLGRFKVDSQGCQTRSWNRPW